MTQHRQSTAGELRHLVDSQADIVARIAANEPLEEILVTICDQLAGGWSRQPTFAAIMMAAADDDRSVFAGGTLRESWPEAHDQLFPPTLPTEPAGLVSASTIEWTGLDAVRAHTGCENVWYAPLVADAGALTSWLALAVPNGGDLHEVERTVLDRHAQLGSIAIERHRGELLLHRLIAEERQRLAGVLHDDPIQAMTAVSLRVQRLGRHVGPEAVGLVHELQRSVTTAIDRMRRLLIDLHPPTLDDEGLVSAIDVYLAEVLEPLDVECVLDDQVIDEPSIETASLAYRLAAEALWNTAKHADASRVVVTIRAESGAVDITVRDDGKGFDMQRQVRTRAGHMGLSACRELSSRASGTWRIDSSPGNGTTVTIHLPGELPVRTA